MILIALATGLLGCHNKDDNTVGGGADSATPLPDRVCNPAAEWTGDAQAYVDGTEAWGLAGINGSRLSTADLDGDGYPDLVISDVSAHTRDDFEAGTRYHYLFMNRPGPDGGRIFEDVTESSGLFTTRDGGNGRAAQIHVYGDVDNDGDLDVFSGSFYDANNEDTDPGDRSELDLNNGDGTFTLAPRSDIHIDEGYATAGAAFADVNNDGKLDLWVTGWYVQYGYYRGEQDRLYLGNGDGTFDEVTESAGLEMEEGSSRDGLEEWLDGTARRPAYGATACDLDGDADADLLTSNYGRSWNQQWMNDGGVFTDVSMESGFAGDDNLDYSDNQFYRCYCEVYGCDPDPGRASLSPCEDYAAYWAAGYDDQPARLNGNSFSTACGDVDNDGDLDLMTAEISHWHIGQSSDPSELLLNDGDGSHFTRPGNDTNGLARDWPSNSWNAGDLFVAFMDFDLDGWKDILLASSDYPDTRMFLWRQVSEGSFEEVAETAGVAHPWPAGLAVADFDLDGDLDVVTGSSIARSGTPWTSREIHLYENQLGPGNTARITLQGQTANRAGIGARVAVTAGGLTQIQEVSGGYGHFGMHHDVALTFGLGEACDIDQIEVTWPGGEVDTWTDQRANYRMVLEQGGGVTYSP